MEIIFAAAVAAFAQLLKKYSPSTPVTIFMVVGMSVAVAGIYVALVDLNFWQEAIRIFTIASAIYAVLIQPFENNGEALPNG